MYIILDSNFVEKLEIVDILLMKGISLNSIDMMSIYCSLNYALMRIESDIIVKRIFVTKFSFYYIKKTCVHENIKKL